MRFVRNSPVVRKGGRQKEQIGQFTLVRSVFIMVYLFSRPADFLRFWYNKRSSLRELMSRRLLRDNALTLEWAVRRDGVRERDRPD
mgnify:CR=1 FL=1